MSRLIGLYRQLPLELICWTSALVLLALYQPSQQHSTWCPLSQMGFQWCPGCGLGRSISHLLQGNIRGSIEMHVLGIPAVLILLHRIFILTKRYLTLFKNRTT